MTLDTSGPSGPPDANPATRHPLQKSVPIEDQFHVHLEGLITRSHMDVSGVTVVDSLRLVGVVLHAGPDACDVEATFTVPVDIDLYDDRDGTGKMVFREGVQPS